MFASHFVVWNLNFNFETLSRFFSVHPYILIHFVYDSSKINLSFCISRIGITLERRHTLVFGFD